MRLKLVITKIMVLFALLIFNTELKAQNFPLEGATWYFGTNNPYAIDKVSEKWEYIEDSITSDRTYKVIRSTRKIVNPGWYTTDTVVEQTENNYFYYQADQVWRLEDTLSPIADFSLNVGDSIYTPYHSTNSPLFPNIFESDCLEETQELFFQKGVVTEVGIDTEDEIESRFYWLKFKNELGEWISRKFSERSIITEGFWHYNNEYQMDCSTTDGVNLLFLCYQDDLSSDTICADEYLWFQTLNIEEEKDNTIISVFPNPASTHLNITLPADNNANYIITDLQTRILQQGVLNSSNAIIDIASLPANVYFIQIEQNGESSIFKFIKE